MKMENSISRFTSTVSYMLILLLFIPATSPGGESLAMIPIMVAPEVRVEAELAQTPDEWARGLMFRESLEANQGMLFVFPDLEYHNFWMKNTLIPLDIIWMNERQEVIYLLTLQPCKEEPCPSFGPMQKAKYVLELNAGFCKKHDIRLGARLEFYLPEPE